ncbi:MAG: DUF4430 domain-containing protein [Lachnospiraceae bacterium]
MQIKRLKTSLSCILCIVLIAAMALFTTGCNDNKTTGGSESPEVTQSVTSPTGTNDNTDGSEQITPEPTSESDKTDDNVLGEGSTKFFFIVVDKDGNETSFEIHTDETTVGAALLGVELIAGEDSAYGLYVKTVNGVTLDYDTDGMYWAFYIDGEYAMTGVDSTDVTEGATYTFKAEK